MKRCEHNPVRSRIMACEAHLTLLTVFDGANAIGEFAWNNAIICILSLYTIAGIKDKNWLTKCCGFALEGSA